MSIRKINTTISTIRSVFDENGTYLPAGNYFYSIDDYNNGLFTGELKNNGRFGKFCFSPKKLVKMLAVGQSRLVREGNISERYGVLNYPIPSTTLNNIRNANLISEPQNRVIREPVTCSICLDNISNLDVKELYCNHKFHRNCINTWLQDNNTCPLCRQFQGSNRNVSTNNRENNREIDSDSEEEITSLSIPLRYSSRYRINTLYDDNNFRRYHRNGNRTITFSSRYSRK
tara:strand:+ start:43 stop:732 length:690 start_codon:yes stop_codon:yes gene_type:complete